MMDREGLFEEETFKLRPDCQLGKVRNPKVGMNLGEEKS